MPTREFLFFFRPFLATPCAISQQSPCGYSPYYVSRELLQSEAFGIKSPPPPPTEACRETLVAPKRLRSRELPSSTPIQSQKALQWHPHVSDRESCPQAHRSNPRLLALQYSAQTRLVLKHMCARPCYTHAPASNIQQSPILGAPDVPIGIGACPVTRTQLRRRFVRDKK